MNDILDDTQNPPQNQDWEAQLVSAPRQKPQKKSSYEGQLTIDVYQTERDIIVKSTIAGVTADDLDISITNDMVTIKGKRQPDERVSPDQYYYQELFWGNFSRAIILPEEIDADHATATLKNGILTLHLPKLAKTREKKLKVLG